jgi:high-affinity iron transporter
VRLWPLTCLVVLGAMTLPALAAAETQATPQTRAERVVFLLQYVASDYAAAVRDGAIVDESEYRENVEFASQAADEFAAIRDSLVATKAALIERALGDLVRLVHEHGSPAAVKQACEAAIPVLIEAFGLHAFPRERPNMRRAAALFADNCTPCHGPLGEGDGPRAKELDPPPAKLSDAARLDETAPYVFYNAITLGVANTAMASFAESLSDQERWDLAFHLWSLRRPPPVTTVPPLKVSLRDLATRSSRDLAPDVIRQAADRGATIDGETALAWIARLRIDPPDLTDPEERLARLRLDLAEAVALVRSGKLDAAADRVTTSYLTEFEPLEPAIDQRDRRVRTRFERSLVDFREAIRRSDAAAALSIAGELGAIADQAERMLTAKPIPRAWKWLGLLVAVTVIAVVAILVAGRRVGSEPGVG